MVVSEDFEDLERILVDYLTDQEWPSDIAPVHVGTSLPADWTPSSPTHVVIAVDNSTATYAWERPGALYSTALIRVTAWGNAAPGTSAGSPSRAKRAARLSQSALMNFPARPVSGVVASADPETRAPIATCTVEITQTALA